MAPYKLPGWIPSPVAEFVQRHPDIYVLDEQNQQPKLDEHERQLKRLVTDFRMEKVYRSLKRHSDDEQHLVEFVREAWIFAGDLPTFKPLPRSQYKKRLQSISKFARRLAQDLDEFYDHGLDIPSWLDSPFSLAMEARQDEFGYALKNLLDKDAYLSQQQPPTVYQILYKLAELSAEESGNQPRFWWNDEIVGPVPRKLTQGNFEHLIFLRRLSAMTQKLFGTPLHETVATTTNVIFGLSDKYTVEDVRHLIKPGK